jgi:hypothetical protein
MRYYTNLFSPETYEAFSRSDRSISGFRVRQRKAASRVKEGDRFICYMTKLSRWVGVFEVLGTYFEDDTPIFYPEDDPFVIRFKVRPLAWLDKEKAIPIKDERVWEHLSFTRGLDKKSPTWTGQVRGSLNRMKAEDGQFLEELILSQAESGETFPIDEREYEKLITILYGELTRSSPSLSHRMAMTKRKKHRRRNPRFVSLSECRLCLPE